MTKFAAERPYSDPQAAARKLIELAASIEPVQDGRIHIEKINYLLIPLDVAHHSGMISPTVPI